MSIVVALIPNIIAIMMCTVSAFLVESKFMRALDIALILINAICIGINLMRL